MFEKRKIDANGENYMEHIFPNAWLKAKILAGRTVSFSEDVPALLCNKNNSENHHHDEWIFIRLSETSRVRLVIDDNNPAFSIIYKENSGLTLLNNQTGEELIQGLNLEDAVIHAPDQLFLGLYEYCRIGCKFCPLHTTQGTMLHYSLDSIYKDIDDSSKKSYSSIGITTSIPYNLTSDDVADEMIFVVRKIREKVGFNIPIGVSTRIPSERIMEQLKNAGANEIRLNIEVPNSQLSHKLMPNKSLEDIYNSLALACKVFGKGKVSSNIVLGLGESDQDVICAIRRLAKLGVIATLYPYDPFDGDKRLNLKFDRPDAERIYRLAVSHKEILDEYQLSTSTLLTMCPACAASHVFPGKDL